MIEQCCYETKSKPQRFNFPICILTYIQTRLPSLWPTCGPIMGHDDFQNVYTKAKLSSKHCSNASVYFWHHKQLRLTTGPCYPGAPTSQESFQIHFPSRKAFNLIIKKNKNTETHPGNYGNPNGTICFDFPLFGPLWVEANSMSNEKSFQNMARTGSDEPI